MEVVEDLRCGCASSALRGNMPLLDSIDLNALLLKSEVGESSLQLLYRELLSIVDPLSCFVATPSVLAESDITATVNININIEKTERCERQRSELTDRFDIYKL